MDDFVQISLGTGDMLDNDNPDSKIDKTTKEIRGTDLQENEVEMEAKEEGAEGIASLESSTGDLGDISLDELLEIEKQIPDDIEHTTPPTPPNRPETPFQEEYSPPSHPRSERAPRYPPGLGFGLDNHPTPLFSNPVSPGAFFADNADDDTEDEEDGEIREDGGNGHGRICWSEAYVTRAEWELGTDPTLGRYRVNHLTNLRYCWTIVREA